MCLIKFVIQFSPKELNIFGSILPTRCHIFHVIIVSDDNSAHVHFKNTFAANFTKHKEGTSVRFLKITTALNPRFKNLKCLPKSDRDEVWSMLSGVLKEQHLIAEITEPEPPKKKINLLVVASDSDDENEYASVSCALDCYRAEPVIGMDACFLEWWLKHEGTNESLAHLTHKYLVTPVTTVMFSFFFFFSPPPPPPLPPSRNFFTKRTKELKPGLHSAPGWKLFGKVPPRENFQKDSKIIQQEYEARTGRTCKPAPQATRRKTFEFEPLSTTALILEDRPSNLPAKSIEEALRHRQEYDEMVAEAKKREIKEAHKRKRIMKERFKQEENIASAMVIWINEILPNWEGMRTTRRVRELWWQGLPPSVRGKVWSLAIGNELNITHELYEIFLSRAKERWKSFSETNSENDIEDAGVSVADREASLELIKLDISRTFPSFYIFQKGGPYHDLLHSVLGAYTCYRPDVGYVQGMSFIAAVLILNLEEADAFIAFANLLNKPCQLAFFRVDHSMMLKYFAAFEVFFEENLPKLFLHFKSYSLTPDIYLIDWIFTLYSKSLPLDLACRVWDVFCRDGEEFLFRTGLGILRLYEDILLQMDFIHIAQFLTKLPEDITSEKLFSCIAAIQMQNSNKKWAQVTAPVRPLVPSRGKLVLTLPWSPSPRHR
uniref:TBC1 domain family member 12 n=1 Tax=Chrysemys picta bellii TaxID=8478 RepID=A0A8C3ISR3_CHRPI